MTGNGAHSARAALVLAMIGVGISVGIGAGFWPAEQAQAQAQKQPAQKQPAQKQPALKSPASAQSAEPPLKTADDTKTAKTPPPEEEPGSDPMEELTYGEHVGDRAFERALTYRLAYRPRGLKPEGLHGDGPKYTLAEKQSGDWVMKLWPTVPFAVKEQLNRLWQRRQAGDISLACQRRTNTVSDRIVKAEMLAATSVGYTETRLGDPTLSIGERKTGQMRVKDIIPEGPSHANGAAVWQIIDSHACAEQPGGPVSEPWVRPKRVLWEYRTTQDKPGTQRFHDAQFERDQVRGLLGHLEHVHTAQKWEMPVLEDVLWLAPGIAARWRRPVTLHLWAMVEPGEETRPHNWVMVKLSADGKGGLGTTDIVEQRANRGRAYIYFVNRGGGTF